MNPRIEPYLGTLIVLSIVSLALAAAVAALYSYSALTELESGGGMLLLLAAAGVLWYFRRQAEQRKDPTADGRDIQVGLALGLLWAVEIGINNFIAPPLPGRDIIDNLFWAVIALSMLGLAALRARQTASLRCAIAAGFWCGFASGLVACAMALALVVFGMGFITQDPLNLAEWAGQVSTTLAPSMAAYFAFETFAGAFAHLLVLGIAMGGLLGVPGGILGIGLHWAAPRSNRIRTK